jgi:excisionase family DNA binding protein
MMGSDPAIETAEARQDAGQQPEKILLSLREVAERLSLGKTKVYELVQRGQLSHIHIGRAVRVPTSALEAFVQRRLEEDSVSRD